MEDTPVTEAGYTLWMREMSKGVVQLHSDLSALTKAVDGLTQETRAGLESAKATADVLRCLLDREAERQNREDESVERRDQWLQRAFGSQPGQLLLLGLVYFALQQFGPLGWTAAVGVASGGL